ncbi:MAG: 50S ribosomal protein L9 [Actinomycetota bacterium]|nr:50S ribosomal protein L9 [Actinomycetes bacterium]MDZ7839038.1 50S ribosomal protein L9 [Actinomycetota bacterium]
MEIILKKYQENLGDVGDIVKVKDGYAKNYLIPNGIALQATKGNIKQMELIKKAVQKVEAKNIAEAEKLAEQLKDMEITFVVKTSEEGKLYGSITNKDIAEKILEQKQVEVDKKKIALDEHLKEIGNYDIEIKLYKDVKCNLKVNVESDQPVEAEPQPEKSEESSEQSEAQPEDNKQQE